MWSPLDPGLQMQSLAMSQKYPFIDSEQGPKRYFLRIGYRAFSHGTACHRIGALLAALSR